MAHVVILDAERDRRPEQKLEDDKLRLVRVLLDSLSPEARAKVAQELVRSMQTAPSGASPTDVLATILQFKAPSETVTTAQLKDEIAQRGVQAAPKEVYNAIGYLARAGKLTRIGYGRYLVNGVEIGTSDQLGGERDRLEDVADGD